ncbi:MAG TPA: ABC transporter permease [Actinomycetota bacterium]|nr:ABC transporter permease [Actinomycetota bacterium]
MSIRGPGSLPPGVTFTSVWRWPRPSFRMAYRMWERDLLSYSHRWHLNLVPNFFEPFFYLLAIGFGLGKFVATIKGIEYARYIAPGLAAVSGMYGASFEVSWNVFFKLHFAKLYDAVTVTPIDPEDVVVGEMMWGITRSLMYSLPFVLISALFGLVHSWWVLLTPVAGAAIGMCFSTMGLTFSSLIPTSDFFSFYWTLFLVPMFLFSSIFFPIDSMPAWAQSLAWFSPLFHCAALFRELFGTFGTDKLAALGHFIWLLGLSAILWPVPQNIFRQRLVT